MSNYKNSEGYYDPTAGAVMEAIARDERKARLRKKQYKPLVYIVSKYAGEIERNTLMARWFCRFAAVNNYIPIASHLLYPQFLRDYVKQERELGLFYGKVLMDKCDEVWIFSDGHYSQGMQAEYEHAIKKGLTIRYFNLTCQEIYQYRKHSGDMSSTF